MSIIVVHLLQVPYHEHLTSAWFNLISADYVSTSYISSSEKIDEPTAKSMGMYVCFQHVITVVH